jgi:hypothetical protein
MSASASQAAAFYREVATSKTLWTIRDEGGFPAPMGRDGIRAQPFWSSRSRTEKIIENVPAYNGFTPVEVTWEEFVTKWVPGFTRDGMKIGVNWSGRNATGYDIEAESVKESVEALFDPDHPWWKKESPTNRRR